MSAPTLIGPALRRAHRAIAAVRDAGHECANAVGQEAELIRLKPERKMAAVARLMALDNPLIPGRAYTYTAAEAVAEIDPEYHAFLRQMSAAAVQRELARTETVCAKLEAQLHLAALLSEAGAEAGDD
jgi:hypothetical protein